MTSRNVSLGLVLLLACACGGGGGQSTPTTPQSIENASSVQVAIEQGIGLVREGRCAEAIRDGFEPAIAELERVFPEPRRSDRVAEANAAALQALAPGSLITTDDLTPTLYPDALYMIAFCHIELGDMAAAERFLARALAVIPEDVMYLSELGHIYQTRHDFQKALDNYTRAVASVEALRATAAGGSLRIMGADLRSWHGRALRGVGFSLIELGRLDEAEATYRRALAINPEDEQAQVELRFIAERRAEQ